MRDKGAYRRWSSAFGAFVFVRLSASAGFGIVFCDSRLATAMLMLWPTSDAISTICDSLRHSGHKLISHMLRVFRYGGVTPRKQCVFYYFFSKCRACLEFALPFTVGKG